MRINLFIDEEAEPRASFDAPGNFDLDTTGLSDGPHTLIVRADDPDGPPGLERIPFTVRNGPGIAIFGIREGEMLRGRVPILVNAFASRLGDEFEPGRAETPAPVPTWAWVLSLVVAVWAIFFITDQYRQHAADLAASAPLPSIQKPKIVSSAASASLAPMSAESSAGADWTALGEQVFGNYCSACHQLSGEGLAGVFPPLRGDPVVLDEDASEHIRIILEGLSGREINGIAYGAGMPAFGDQLSDEQIAAVVNHERSNWGNAAVTVGPDEVAGKRSERPLK